MHLRGVVSHLQYVFPQGSLPPQCLWKKPDSPSVFTVSHRYVYISMSRESGRPISLCSVYERLSFSVSTFVWRSTSLLRDWHANAFNLQTDSYCPTQIIFVLTVKEGVRVWTSSNCPEIPYTEWYCCIVLIALRIKGLIPTWSSPNLQPHICN